jgi:uncharacterized cupredoxin-like copper-binding protein
VVNRISIALAVVAALALAGAATGAMAGRTAAKKSTIQVTEREYRISLSTKSLPAGVVRLVVHNAGHVAHKLSISGPGMSAVKTTPMIAPGATRALTVNLGGGSFKLWCPLGSHASLGMKTTLTLRGPVVGGTPTTPTPTPTPPMDPGYGDGY